MQKRYHQLPLRLPSDISDRLRAHANKNGLSMNETVVKALERYTEALPTPSVDLPPPPEPTWEQPPAPTAEPRYRCPAHAAFEVTSSAAQCWCNRRVVPV